MLIVSPGLLAIQDAQSFPATASSIACFDTPVWGNIYRHGY
jgi:hypothetical protein